MIGEPEEASLDKIALSCDDMEDGGKEDEFIFFSKELKYEIRVLALDEIGQSCVIELR